MKFTQQILIASWLALPLMTANANPVTPRVLVAPQCLLKDVHANYVTLAKEDNFALVTIDKNDISQFSENKSQQKTLCGGFFDVTHAFQKNTAGKKIPPATFLSQYTSEPQLGNNLRKKPRKRATYAIQYPTQVHRLFDQLIPDNMITSLTHLSSLEDRYADSETGVEAANWLKTTMEHMAAQYHRNDVTVSFIETGSDYKQPSVLVKVGESKEDGVVIGAHMDTVASDWRGQKPGADDDGSGTVTVLETARAILGSGMHFKRPIYFVWYAAEEEGMVGSSYVVEAFKEKQIPVHAVLHMDMTGYAYHNEPTMWLINDNVNKGLTAYLETLIKTYIQRTVKKTSCGYACSDHATWNRAGYVTAMPAETAFHDTNPNMHSRNDTLDKLSPAHMLDYLKLATAFAVELAEPVDA